MVSSGPVMLEVLVIAVIGLMVAVFFRSLSQANEVFHIRVRNGRCRVRRGRVPPALLGDLEDVVARAGVRRATLRGVREGGRTRLMADGVPPSVAQRLRNVFGSGGFSQLRG